MDKRITEILNLCEELPIQMKRCESECLTTEEICERLVQKTKDLETWLQQLENAKLSHKEQKEYAETVAFRFKDIDHTLDKAFIKQEELNYFVDVYMPIRL